jgi:succinate dehydrogenase/fumarate reductase flavoprotein subunit
MAPRLVVAGAGMAGLVAAVRAAELGARPTVYEKGDRAGGSMVLSSGVIWRHASWEAFREECPAGDPALQRLVWARLDGAIEWLHGLGAPVVAGATGNPRTVGVRFDPRGLRDALLARLPRGSLLLGRALPLDEDGVTVLATGGFAASPELVGAYVRPAAPLPLRASPWSSGDGLRLGLARGAALSAGMDEFYGRNMPAAPWSARDFVPMAQLYASRARIVDEGGEEFFRAADVTWAETNVVQATARRPNARAYYLLGAEAVADPAVAEIVARAPSASRPPLPALPFAPPAGTAAAVHVAASITHTIGGLRIDEAARVLGADGRPLEGLHAAGVDAGGIAAGGYASGLAQALVLGLTAAESAVAATS